MKPDRLTSPGKRQRRINVKPSAFAAVTPLSEFLVPPSDPKGRTVTTHVAVPPAFLRLAEIVLHSDSLPFKSHQDVFRWCIQQCLGHLVSMTHNTDLKTEWSLMKSWCDIM